MKAIILIVAAALSAAAVASDRTLDARFESPVGADRANTGPLFWLHGTESPELLERMVDVVADSGQGVLTVESRHHCDWMGPIWWRDLSTVLARVRRNGLKAMIFDDPWWPSQAMRGRVPDRYGCHMIDATVVKGAAPAPAAGEICRIRCAETAPGTYRPGEGDVTVVFTDVRRDIRVNEGGVCMRTVNGLDPDAVDWFIGFVYEEHYRRYRPYFDDGTVIGFFFDEPETHGEWGPALADELRARGDWDDLGRLLLAYKFRLADADEGARLRHRYLDARAEAWGKTMYGRLSDWCARRGVFCSGHFMEHGDEFYSQRLCAGDVMKMEKYVTVPGIDLVCSQYYPADQDRRPESVGQMPKIASSSAHVQNRFGGKNWCEIFGGYGQKLTYPEMKWLCDWHQVRGCHFLIPHSFNPKAPSDTDYPPYFYNAGLEPRYPLFRVWTDYNNRCALMLSDGEHVCPIAQCLPGQSRNTGRALRPERLTFAIQDAQLDCDWISQEDLATAVVEDDPRTGTPSLRMARGREHYPVLTLPAAELVDFAALEKALAFAKRGGRVIGYAIRPSDTFTRGKGPGDVKALADELFRLPTVRFFAAEPTPRELRDAVPAHLDPKAVVGGLEPVTNLHVCAYVKDGYHICFIANQNTHDAQDVRFFQMDGAQLDLGAWEFWNPMQGTREPAFPNGLRTYRLEPGASVFLVAPPKGAPRAAPLADANRTLPLDPSALRVVRTPVPSPPPGSKDVRGPFSESVVTEGSFTIPGFKPGQRVVLACAEVKGEPAARISVNGTFAGGFIGRPFELDVSKLVREGVNELRIEPFAVEGLSIRW